MREKREELNKSIAADEEEKGTRAPPLQLRCFYSADGTLTVCCRHRAPAAKIQNDLRILTERLARINDNLARKVSSRTEYDKTITQQRLDELNSKKAKGRPGSGGLKGKKEGKRPASAK